MEEEGGGLNYIAYLGRMYMENISGGGCIYYVYAGE